MTSYTPDPKWRFVEGYRRAHYFDGPSSLCGAHTRPAQSFACLTPDDAGCKACWAKLLDKIGTPKPEDGE